MNAILLHHLGVPCIAKFRSVDESICQDDFILYLNPDALVRYEFDGALVTPPMLYASFIKIDNELAELFRQRFFSSNGLPNAVLSLLIDNQILSKTPYKNLGYREMFVNISGLPAQVLLDVTSSCNCNCITCYHRDDLDNYAPPLGAVIDRIKKLKDLGLGLFEVTGGEPLLRNDLANILEFISDLELHFYVVSNGEFIRDANDKLIAAFKKGLGIAVSVDGVGDIHDNVRRRDGLYKKMLEGLDLFYHNGIKIYLISTLNEANISCMDDMVELAARYNTTIHFRPTIRTGAALVNDIRMINLKSKIEKFLGHPNVRNGLLSMKKTIPNAQLYGCGIRKRISVSSKGFLFPCVMDRGSNVSKIEDYTQESLVYRLHERTVSFLNQHSSCRLCDINNDGIIRCGGFCRFSVSYNRGKE